jgi:biotin carboxyl carrier protein
MAKRARLSDGDAVWQADVDGARVALDSGRAFTVRAGDDGYDVEGDGIHGRAVAVADGDTVWVALDGDVFAIRVVRGSTRGGADDADRLSAPMPATVVRVAVAPGQAVAAGDLLVALEAMKMELPVRAPRDAVVSAVHCREGELVQPGLPLVELE